MNNSLKTNARCYILDNYNKKHNFDIEMTEVHNNEAFIFFKTKPFYSNGIQLFIYRSSKRHLPIRARGGSAPGHAVVPKRNNECCVEALPVDSALILSCIYELRYKTCLLPVLPSCI